LWIDNLNKLQESVGNGHARSLQTTVANSSQTTQKNQIYPQLSVHSNPPPKIIRHSNSTIYSVWQKSFHDRVIRDEDELNRIREYIFANPENWEKDENNCGLE